MEDPIHQLLLLKGASLFQPRKVGAISLQNSSFSSILQCLPDFCRFPKSSENGVVFVAAAGGCLVKYKEWSDLFGLGKEAIVFICTFNPFTSWLTKWQKISWLWKDRSVELSLCLNEEIKHKTWMANLYCVSIYIWLNYRRTRILLSQV